MDASESERGMRHVATAKKTSAWAGYTHLTFGRERMLRVKFQEFSLRATWYTVRSVEMTCSVDYTTLAG